MADSGMLSGWEMVVGLEVHTELLTATKLFCGCANEFGAEPNTNVCPVCLGLPGSLPVLNQAAVDLAVRIGVALHASVGPSLFHRKNYFYPDMPKDYQISQYDEPICSNGWLEPPGHPRVGIVRAHLEEDTGKTSHMGGDGRIHGAERSLVDYNRAGVPLVEIVSAPDIWSSGQARAYVSELRAILIAIGASDGRMEEGSLRVDANVSVMRKGATSLGTRCEIKNLNSLRSLGRAIDYEARRQVDLLNSGGVVEQETRHWNESTGRTASMRSKEEAFDYRYFPDPDLVPLDPGEDWVDRVRLNMAPLPADRRAALEAAVGEDASSAIAGQIATVVELGLDGLVTAAISEGVKARLAVARAANEAAAAADAARSLDAGRFVQLLKMEDSAQLSASQTKAVLAELLAGAEGSPEEVAARLGLGSMDSAVLDAALDAVIQAHPEEWERFRGGDNKVIGFLVGQVMRSTQGKADGKAVRAGLASRI